MAKNWLQKETGNARPELVLQDVFGHEAFRDGQRAIIDATLKGKDVYCVAPTAKGKSLCYQLPALMEQQGVSTLIVSPLIALMNDQMKKMTALKIPVADIHSLNAKRAEVLLKIAQRQFAIIFSSPEQLQKDDVVQALKNANIGRMVADEAHCLSTWGHDFRPDYGELGDVRAELGIPRVSSFTATASPQVERDIKRTLGMNGLYDHKEPGLRPNLNYSVLPVKSYREKPDAVAKLIREFAPGKNDAAIIYCGRRGDVGRYVTTLKLQGITANDYHGEMGSRQRKQVEEGFINDEPPVLVATNAFGMGIDKPNIRLIVHSAIPGSVQSYLQETGRAGRDGEDAQCTLLFSEEDKELQEYFIEQKCPGARYTLGVYKTLDEIRDRRSYKPGQQFFIDMFPFYRTFDQKQFRLGGMEIIQNDSKVNAAMSILKLAGVLEKRGASFRLDPFNDKLPIFTVVSEMVKQRRVVAEFLWNQMLEYARNKKPSQEFLLDLLQQEVA